MIASIDGVGVGVGVGVATGVATAFATAKLAHAAPVLPLAVAVTVRAVLVPAVGWISKALAVPFTRPEDNIFCAGIMAIVPVGVPPRMEPVCC